MLLSVLLFACKKENDFVDEDAIGSGVHYYPDILTQHFYDTTSRYNISDANFPQGGKVTFEVDFRAREGVTLINLYATTPDKVTRQVESIPYSSDFYSSVKQADTLFFSYAIPDTVAGNRIDLRVEVVTAAGLSTSQTDYVKVQ
ncbi:hypothetical protein [Compostibacter hankyongensis]|uniref:DUF1735 domain-containing protein n=1 Tax=Compostibacter hankyongensis TaxID=1007089 RepID=A0ABP8FNB0_9BACT